MLLTWNIRDVIESANCERLELFADQLRTTRVVRCNLVGTTTYVVGTANISSCSQLYLACKLVMGDAPMGDAPVMGDAWVGSIPPFASRASCEVVCWGAPGWSLP